METLIPLDLPPGVRASGTLYQSRNRWARSHLVRWVEGALRPVGGWVQQTDGTGVPIQVSGKPRNGWSWRKNDSAAWLSTGTATKLYAFAGSGLTLTDITPAGFTTGAVDGSQTGGGLGYGLGGYGLTPYGGFGASVVLDADTWSLDNFGEILLACFTADGKIYESSAPTQATQTTNSPTGCRAVCVTPERFVFALGAGSDPRNVRWSGQGDRTVWTAAASNQAGSFPLQTTGRLIAGRRTQRETLLWTDTDLWGATYVGGNLIYRFDQRGESCGLIGPNAFAIAGGAAFWMGRGQFFSYSGAVRSLPAEVSDYVFANINLTQRAKICCIPVEQFGEVWWFYPSAAQSGLENDRYVMLNYRDGYWALGSIGRNAGTGAGAFTTPMLWDAAGYLYAHETGQDRSGSAAFIESGPLELDNGDRVVRLQSLIPDELLAGQVEATLYGAFQPETPEVSSGPYPLTPVTNIRATARQFRLRLSEVGVAQAFADGVFLADGSAGAGAPGYDFRIGRFRVGGLAGGYR